jgi:uncharacterized OB-fold protein
VSSRIPHQSSDAEMSASAVSALTRQRVAVVTQCPSCGRKIGPVSAADVRCPHHPRRAPRRAKAT